MNFEAVPGELEKYMYEIINQAKNGITISDPHQEDNPLIFVNGAFEEIFGYSKKEVLGKNCRFLQGDDRDQSNLDKIREAIKQQTETTTVLRNYTKEGKLVYNEIKVSPIFDKKTKKLKYFLGIQKDITDAMAFKNQEIEKQLYQKFDEKESYTKEEVKQLLQELSVYQTEILAQNDELRQKDQDLELLNREFTTLFQDAPLPLMLVDKSLLIKKFNTKANDLFGFDLTKVQIKSLFKYINTQHMQTLIAWINDKEYESRTLEIDMIMPDQTSRRFKIQARQYSLDTTLLLFSMVDIQEEYEIKTNLQKKVQEQLDDVLQKEQIIQNQSKYATMGEMIDAIAHQWKQPLNIVSMKTSFLAEMNQDEKMVEIEEVLECKNSVMKQIEHLVETLEQFRDFMRPNKPKQVFDIKETIQSVLTLVQDDLVKHNIEVTVDDKDRLYCKAVENEIKHVFINIINNAKDIFVERNIKDKRIDITLSKQKGQKIITIADNAGGIDEKIIHQVFENNFSGRKEGTGIGLFMSKQIIEKMFGQISVYNQNNGGSKGAVFKLILPRTE